MLTIDILANIAKISDCKIALKVILAFNIRDVDEFIDKLVERRNTDYFITFSVYNILHHRHRPAIYSDRGISMWYCKGEFHRLDGPAVSVGQSGRWYQNGKLHRLDGPAIEDENHKEWYQNGLLHRLDGPAIEDENHKEWYQNGLLHRLDGPAIERNDGELWYQNGKLHRLDGPAINTKTLIKWYIEGIQQ